MSTITTPSQPASSSQLKHLISGHPLVAYFVIAFAGTWLTELPLVLGKDGLGLLSYHVPFPLFVALFLLSSYAGPTLGAFLVTAASEGKAGVRHLLRRYLRWRVGLQWYLLVLLGYPAVYLLVASVFLGTAPLNALIHQWPLFFTSYLPAILVFPAIITWGEEPGWRGFALPRLQRQYGPLIGSLILGFLHGIWHLPAFQLPFLSGGPFNILSFAINTLAIMIVTITWTWVFNNTRGSILIAVLLHAAFNANGSLIHQLVPAMPVNGWADLAALLLVTLLIIIFTRGRLGYNPEQNAQLIEVTRPAEVPLAVEGESIGHS